MTLLPQPTANKIAEKISQVIGGDLFFGNESTQASFRKYAGNHKVIHIATHAEYNNVYPEKSRLIFAKDSHGTDSNLLYLTDIYNCDLRSDVAVLTACESGRPGYRDGEGMVSLAHAFNYAGSKNILTALWKIDEQSSSVITELFIRNLKEGMPTDEALRSAKLDYLRKANGRLADPGYWAGLVLMGKPIVIDFNSEFDYVGWTGATIFFVSASLFFISRRRTRKKAA
jgi:CHAT domain-containing protein